MYDTTKTSKYTLTWEPLFASVAQSGEIGYTYGTYRLSKTYSDNIFVADGCYTTIWKKDASGKWKWILDTGTDGLPKKKKQ